jgi:hypothetical protein
MVTCSHAVEALRQNGLKHAAHIGLGLRFDQTDSQSEIRVIKDLHAGSTFMLDGFCIIITATVYAAGIFGCRDILPSRVWGYCCMASGLIIQIDFPFTDRQRIIMSPLLMDNSSIENDMLSGPIHTRKAAPDLAVIGSQDIPFAEEDFLSHSI